MLVMSNNFMQLFFGWEGVGVVSYLLIGFWYTRPTATFAALKAFLVEPGRRLRIHPRDCGDLAIHGIARLRRRCSRTPSSWSTRRSSDTRPRLAGDHVCLYLPVRGRDGQVRADAAACVVAGFDGRPDADLGADPRGHHGDGGHFHGGAHVAACSSCPRRRSRSCSSSARPRRSSWG